MNAITINALHFAYPGPVDVFSGLDLQIQEGEKAGMTGSNGTGKSTLFLLLMGLLKPRSGTISLWNRPMKTEHDFKKARLKTGFLFQDPDDQLFCPSVEEDIAFALLNRGAAKDDALRKVAAICETFGITHLRKRVPFHLSWGQKRLVSLAGILITKPDLLLLDEPTAGADDRVVSAIAEYIGSFEGTVVISSHDRSFLEATCSSSYRLEKSRFERVEQVLSDNVRG